MLERRSRSLTREAPARAIAIGGRGDVPLAVNTRNIRSRFKRVSVVVFHCVWKAVEVETQSHTIAVLCPKLRGCSRQVAPAMCPNRSACRHAKRQRPTSKRGLHGARPTVLRMIGEFRNVGVGLKARGARVN